MLNVPAVLATGCACLLALLADSVYRTFASHGLPAWPQHLLAEIASHAS